MDPRPEPPAPGQQAAEAFRHVPYDIDIEQALLGAMLTTNRFIDVAAAEIQAEDFYDPLHGRMFDAIVYMATEGEVNPLILHAVMKADPGVIETGGMAYMGALASAAPAIPNVRDYCNILRDLGAKRRLITIGEDLVNRAYDQPLEVTSRQLADRASDALLEIGANTSKPRRSVFQIAMDAVHRMDRAMQGEPIPVVKTGWEKVDEELGGLRGGDLTVILGKSGMGKSAMMGGLALNTARAGIPTLVISLEMTEDQWVERMVCDQEFDGENRPLWYSKVRNASLDHGEFARFMLSAQGFDGWPIEIIDDADLSMQQIAARARAFKAKHKNKLGIVIIDYLQIVDPANDRDNRERQVNAIAHGAKVLAKKLDWPVVAGSQMNEGDTARAKEERRPQPSDARESKGIQHEADLMLAPYRPAYWVEIRKPLDLPPGAPDWQKWISDLKAVRNRFELLVLKNRHGRKKDFELYCEMGASAIRDSEPRRRLSVEDEYARDLLEGLVS